MSAWLLVGGAGPSDAANATSTSPAEAENGAVVRAPPPVTDTVVSAVGDVVDAGPSDITKLTALPCAAAVLPLGVWLTTCPTGTVELLALVTLPTVSCAPVMAFCAAVCDSPSTLGR